MKISGITSNYLQALKNPAAEELIDLAFYRPLAFVLVKPLSRFPVTPNQISLFAMLFGIASGIILAGGTKTHWIIGGILFAFANILDCCDGMIARLKHNGTKTGRIVDGLVDYVTNIAAYTGFAIGASYAVFAGTMHLPKNVWLLMAIAGVSTILHSIASDFYRNTFVNQSKPADRAAVSEFMEFTMEWERLSKLPAHHFDKTLVKIYLWYLTLQSRKTTGKAAGRASVHHTPRVSSLSVLLWNLIGPSTHITAVVLAALFFSPMILFVYAIGFANIWLVLLLIVQPLLNRRAS